MISEGAPVIDLSASRDPATRAGFVRALGEGLETWGFVVVMGHDVPSSLVDRTYEAARRTFALPIEDKLACEVTRSGRQRGYTAFGVERARDQQTPDLKEFWHVGRDLPPGHPLSALWLVPPNVFPPQVPELAETTRALFTALEDLSLVLLDAVGEHLGLPDGTFRDLVRDGNSVLRVINYPDPGDSQEGAVRAAAHEDINLMTVLPAATRPGLELLTLHGRWMAVTTPPGAMIVNTGDMMKLYTAGRLSATTHRVVNPPGGSDGGRQSMPFFLHPRPDGILALRDGSKVVAHDYLLERLRENGVMG